MYTIENSEESEFDSLYRGCIQNINLILASPSNSNFFESGVREIFTNLSEIENSQPGFTRYDLDKGRIAFAMCVEFQGDCYLAHGYFARNNQGKNKHALVTLAKRPAAVNDDNPSVTSQITQEPKLPEKIIALIPLDQAEGNLTGLYTKGSESIEGFPLFQGKSTQEKSAALKRICIPIAKDFGGVIPSPRRADASRTVEMNNLDLGDIFRQVYLDTKLKEVAEVFNF